VLRTFLAKSLGLEGSPESSSGSPRHGTIDLDRLRRLLEFFPIAKKLRYYPEYKEEVLFDTFVVAHCVNGNFVYSDEAIRRDSRGDPIAFHAETGDERLPFTGLELFQLLVPDTSDLEMKLDYRRRALIGRGRQFIKGNCISLISNLGSKGVSTVDTEVVQKVVPQDGPYARTKMILLTPELNTLTVSDQRRRARAKTCTPVMVSLRQEAFPGPCTIVDMSEGAVHIRVGGDPAMHSMHLGERVVLDFDLGQPEPHYTIKGLVIRRSPETCVVQFEEMLKNGMRGRFGPLDLLQLKAGLLNYRSGMAGKLKRP